MFANNQDKGGIKEAETIIGPSVKIKGDFNCHGNMIIEGEVEGNVNTEGDLYVGEKAKIKADVKAKNAKISGIIEGNININGYLDISHSAKITGNISMQNLSIAKGALVNGNCSMSQSTEKKAEK